MYEECEIHNSASAKPLPTYTPIYVVRETTEDKRLLTLR